MVKLAPGIPQFVKHYGLGVAGVPFGLYLGASMLIERCAQCRRLEQSLVSGGAQPEQKLAIGTRRSCGSGLCSSFK
jgi:hypothetical protein